MYKNSWSRSYWKSKMAAKASPFEIYLALLFLNRNAIWRETLLEVSRWLLCKKVAKICWLEMQDSCHHKNHYWTFSLEVERYRAILANLLYMLELAHVKTYNMTSKDSYQPVYPPSMARVLIYPSLSSPEAVKGACDQWRLWVAQVLL